MNLNKYIFWKYNIEIKLSINFIYLNKYTTTKYIKILSWNINILNKLLLILIFQFNIYVLIYYIEFKVKFLEFKQLNKYEINK